MKSSSGSAKPDPRGQTISVPREQVTADPIPGYTTQDFWRDFDAKFRGRLTASQEAHKARVRRSRTDGSTTPPEASER